MDIREQIDELILKMHTRGEEIAPVVFLDLESYKDLVSSIRDWSHNTHSGFTSISMVTCIATLEVKCDPALPANTARNNGRTLLDIVVEEELLEN